jgi:hypothetical protein
LIIGIDRFLLSTVFRFLYQRTGVSSCNVELRVSADGLHAITRYGNLSDYDEWARLGGKGAESWAYKDFHRCASTF